MPEVRYYLTEDGNSPFAEWFGSLDAIARAKVATAVARMEQGNLSNTKPVGQVSSSIGSISGPATVFISGATVTCW